MEWIALLKHLAISRSIVAAIFLTSVVMVVGPHIDENIVPSVSQPWSPLLFATMILTGTLLIFWAAISVWHFFLPLFKSAKSSSEPRPNLNRNHFELLLTMGNNPSEPMNIDDINYRDAPFSKLELMQWVADLEKNKLVSINPWSESLVTLTVSGREKALEIQRAVKNA
ncbi:hypothetical protein [Aeromonas enteropelogenes]|uniref:hypothetical protein n=1 Tax=Aeromonas enteropelogenes TaxID=29489 RepID=UPI0038D1799D